jgi:hypothetical protein
MTLKLVAYSHVVRDVEDQAELIFEDDPLPGTVILSTRSVHPLILAALRAHLTGVSQLPVVYRITGLAGERAPSSSAGFATLNGTMVEQVFITLDRIAPSSAQPISATSRLHERWITDILAAFH